MKWKFLIPLFLSAARIAAQALKDKDADSTGVDDEAAAAIEYAIERVEHFQTQVG